MAQAKPASVPKMSRFDQGNPFPRDRKALVQLYFDGLLSQGRVEIADWLLVDEVLFFGPGSDAPVRGREPFKEFILDLRAAFPDINAVVHAVVEEQEQVACWLTVHGTHRGLWRGFQPTGGGLVLQAMNLFRFSGDRITEVRAFFDLADYDTQLARADGGTAGAP
jgi:steroid delta-isomerase-like uncharacterized protein